jgi:hypothetical protein
VVCHTAGKVGIRIVPVEEPFFTNNFFLDPDSNTEQKLPQTHLWKQVVFGCLTKLTRLFEKNLYFFLSLSKLIIAAHGVSYQAQNIGDDQV